MDNMEDTFYINKDVSNYWLKNTLKDCLYEINNAYKLLSDQWDILNHKEITKTIKDKDFDSNSCENQAGIKLCNLLLDIQLLKQTIYNVIRPNIITSGFRRIINELVNENYKPSSKEICINNKTDKLVLLKKSLSDIKTAYNYLENQWDILNDKRITKTIDDDTFDKDSDENKMGILLARNILNIETLKKYMMDIIEHIETNTNTEDDELIIDIDSIDDFNLN